MCYDSFLIDLIIRLMWPPRNRLLCSKRWISACNGWMIVGDWWTSNEWITACNVWITAFHGCIVIGWYWSSATRSNGWATFENELQVVLGESHLVMGELQVGIGLAIGVLHHTTLFWIWINYFWIGFTSMIIKSSCWWLSKSFRKKNYNCCNLNK